MKVTENVPWHNILISPDLDFLGRHSAMLTLIPTIKFKGQYLFSPDLIHISSAAIYLPTTKYLFC